MSVSPSDSQQTSASHASIDSDATHEIRIEVNGESRPIPAGTRVANLLELLTLGGKRVAVAINRDVVARSNYAATELQSGDRVEILEAVGGG